MQIINYLWRVFATGICFTFFGIGSLVLALGLFPMQKLIYQNKQKYQIVARLSVHYAFKFFVNLMKWLGVSQFIVPDKAYFSHLQGHIILANHPSLIDVVVLISLMPNADCVVKAHLFKNPFIRGVVKGTGYISNDDPEALIMACDRSLQHGNNLIIFPEGTRTTPGEPLKFQRGAANIILRCKVPVTNFIITVSPTTLTKAEKWYQIPKQKVQFALLIPKSLYKVKDTSIEVFSKASRVLTRQLQSFFIEELQKYE